MNEDFFRAIKSWPFVEDVDKIAIEMAEKRVSLEDARKTEGVNYALFRYSKDNARPYPPIINEGEAASDHQDEEAVIAYFKTYSDGYTFEVFIRNHASQANYEFRLANLFPRPSVKISQKNSVSLPMHNLE